MKGATYVTDGEVEIFQVAKGILSGSEIGAVQKKKILKSYIPGSLLSEKTMIQLHFYLS